MLRFNFDNTNFTSQFKFLQIRTLHKYFLKVEEDSWKTKVVGCPMFVLTKKLQILKKKPKLWNKSTYGNMQDQVK